jgi:hypothetical protein
MKIVLLIIIILVVGMGYFIINERYNMDQNNLNQDKSSYVPMYDSERESATFNYPGTSFKFSYPLKVSEGATIIEIEKNVSYDLNISSSQQIKVNILDGSERVEADSLNQNNFKYKKFIGNDKFTHIVFYGNGAYDKDVEVIIDVADQVKYSDMIISSFEFLKAENKETNY